MTTIQYSNRISQIRHQLATRKLHLDLNAESATALARYSVADALSQHGTRFEAEDIAFARSPFVALSAVVTAVSDPGDQVVVLGGDAFHTSLVRKAGAEASVVAIDRQTATLDLAALTRALTQSVRAVIIDAQDAVWQSCRARVEVARVLTTAANVFGRPIFVIVDETARQIDSVTQQTADLAGRYPYTFAVGATPGEAVHVAVPATMPSRQQWRPAIVAAQAVLVNTSPAPANDQRVATAGPTMGQLAFAS